MITVYDEFIKAVDEMPNASFLCVFDETGKPKDIPYSAAVKHVEACQKIYANAGYGHGHRIALLLGQCPEMVIHFLALNGLGCTVVPINPDYRHDELLYQMSHSESDMAVVVAARTCDMKAVGEAMNRFFPVIEVGEFKNGIPKASRLVPDINVPNAKTVASILYTSGTTGRPKGCLMSNQCHLMSGDWYASRGGLLAINAGKERFYNPSPFYHINNLAVCLSCVILTRNCLILVERFSPNRWWNEVATSQATVIHYLGIIPSMLMNRPVKDEDRKHAVKFGFGGGVEPQLHRAFEERFGFPLVEIWGMTETPRVFSAHQEPRHIDTRAFGKPTSEYLAKIVDDDDKEVPRGSMGELLVRSSGKDPRIGFFSGYLKNDQATEEAWRGGWFHSGDVCLQDEDGMLYFVDRKKNIVRRGGENISAAEVEATILTHEAVAQVAVIAVKDDIREEEVMACIVIKDNVNLSNDLAEDIFRWCNKRLAYFKTPGWITFRESLPLTPSQRLQRSKIFAPEVDPRFEPGVIDLRTLKKR
ncbi:MAG: hypothetical protein CMG46_09980 [Candidatus Marinimicrobia bacterium]|nr:hypothetical protein [Candidatus Neomarinimicrobiota bacterium]|tara:strand:- start:608 stop:2200 length:1593 start_codon:yes stop_codon:yes gene_type:complete